MNSRIQLSAMDMKSATGEVELVSVDEMPPRPVLKDRNTIEVSRNVRFGCTFIIFSLVHTEQKKMIIANLV